MLDWRERPANSDTVSKIVAKLLDADHLSKVQVELGETSDLRGRFLWSSFLISYVFVIIIKKVMADSARVICFLIQH